MLGKFQTERKYCYAFHTTFIYSLKHFTFSLQAHAYGPRIAVLFWKTETCYPLNARETNFAKLYLRRVFLKLFLSLIPIHRFWGTSKPLDMLTGIIELIWSFVLSIKFYSLASVTKQKKNFAAIRYKKMKLTKQIRSANYFLFFHKFSKSK